MLLPSHYLIPPSPEHENEFLGSLERSLEVGITLMQFRAKGMEPDQFESLARKVVVTAHRFDCKVLLNADPEMVEKVGADGIHLDSKNIAACESRPLPDNYMVAASGHTLEAMQKAERVGATFGVLSPVKYTKAHPDIEPIGWERFEKIVSQLSIPVFALGGVSSDDEGDAHAAGALGIAGKGYWRS